MLISGLIILKINLQFGINKKEKSFHPNSSFFSDQAVKVIEDHKAGQPLFLYLAYQNVHKPIQVPDHYARKYQPYGKLTKVYYWLIGLDLTPPPVYCKCKMHFK